MNSAGPPGQHPQLLQRAIGVGLGYGGSYGTYWTQDFGRELTYGARRLRVACAPRASAKSMPTRRARGP